MENGDYVVTSVTKAPSITHCLVKIYDAQDDDDELKCTSAGATKYTNIKVQNLWVSVHCV